MAQAHHKFRVGSAVRYSAGAYAGAAVNGTYTVTRLLPAEPGDCQYRVKSTRDGHERVVRESQLTPGLQTDALPSAR